MSRLPARHGRDHRPGGYDPLSGDWLHWGDNTDSAGLGLQLHGGGGSGWLFETDGGGCDITQESSAFPGTYGGLNWDAGSFDFDSHGGGIGFDTGDGGFTIDTGEGYFAVNTAKVEIQAFSYPGDPASGRVRLTPDAGANAIVNLLTGSSFDVEEEPSHWDRFGVTHQGDIFGQIKAGAHFVIYDGAGEPFNIFGFELFKIDNDGTVHMKTGANLVFDL